MQTFKNIDDPVKLGGFTFTAEVIRDEDMGPPWKEHDGHGDVSEWERRDKRPGERILCEDRRSRRYYDFAGAVKKAKAEGWDAPPYGGTPGEKANRAAEADFKHLQGWCNDEWNWVGVSITAARGGFVMKGAASLWGIESNSEADILETANELLAEALATAKAGLAEPVAA